MSIKIQLSIARTHTTDEGEVVCQYMPSHTMSLPYNGKRARFKYTGFCGHNNSTDTMTCTRCPPHIFKATLCGEDDGPLTIFMESRYEVDDRSTAVHEFLDSRDHEIAMRRDDIKYHDKLIQEYLQALVPTIDPDGESCDKSLIKLIAYSRGVIAQHNSEIERLQSITTFPFTKTEGKVTTKTVPEGEFTNFIPCLLSNGEITDATYAVMFRKTGPILDFESSPVVWTTTTCSASLDWE